MDIQNRKPLFIFTVILVCVGAVQASDERVEFMGDYRNVKSATGEHCDGYDVMIWKYKESLIGFLNHHRGLCGDPPMGVMEEALYSAQTGSLSFKVKLSDGCTLQDGKCIPTKDKVIFEGSIRGQLLEGTVTWFREGKLQSTDSENVMLAKDPKRSQTRNYETYADWMKHWELILKRRGPQW
jgi:hypothetical protein